jgi:hypothetical protein
MDSLREICSNALRLASIAFQAEASGDLRLPAISREVGDLVIAFDDGEITVYVGRFTHCHFTPGECGDPSAVDHEAECVKTAVDFIGEVLRDCWVMWAYASGAGGCYRLGGDDEASADTPITDNGEHVPLYVWSGACKS